jgi:hypothetical protein
VGINKIFMEALFFDDILSALRNNIISNNLFVQCCLVYKYTVFPHITFPSDIDLQNKLVRTIESCGSEKLIRKQASVL